MVFSSAVFLLYFFPLFFLIYYLTFKQYRNIVLLIASIVFYSWGAPKFIFVILGTTFLDFYLVKWMSSLESRLQRRVLLSISVSINLGLLAYFKYSGFFISNVNAMLSLFGSHEIEWTKLVLPLGISFYTFETITYVVDVYRKVHKPLDNFWDYPLYIILFPKLIAGPIIRYHEIADQLKSRVPEDGADYRLTGFYRFIIGLAKKALIADYLGITVKEVFSMNYANLDCYTAWIGILAFTFQIYFDFSGYSDIAIGLGKMLGFRFPENFNNPYTSQSITEFWRRWHITLGNWMRNYLYIPLGGNRVNTKRRLYFNLWLVFLASGLWHGASWSFVFWGAYHGTFLVLERIFLLDLYKKAGRFFSTALNFLIVVTGWVFFKVEKLSDAFIYLKRMFTFHSGNSFSPDAKFYFFMLLAFLLSFFVCLPSGQKLQDSVYLGTYPKKRHVIMACITVLLFILSLSAITSFGFNSFIYYNF